MKNLVFLPSIERVQAARATLCHVPYRMSASALDQTINRIAQQLHQNGLARASVIWQVAEDATRILTRLEWDASDNLVFGFILEDDEEAPVFTDLATMRQFF